MRLPTMALFMIIMALTIVIFDNTGSVDPSSSQLSFYNSSTVNSSVNFAGMNISVSPSPILNFITHPTGLTQSALWASLLGFIALFLAITISAGILRISSTDAVTFSPLFLLLVSFCFFPVSLLYGWIQREFSNYMCGPGNGFCLFPTVFAIFFAGTLALSWILSCFQQWRTGFTSN
jgi:hypothetical protein